LRRWSSISEGLFDVVEDAKMGVFRDQHHDRLRSLEKRRSLSIPLKDPLDNGEIPNHSSGRDTPFRLPALDDVSRNGESPKVSPHPHPHDESSLKTGMNSKHSKNDGCDELAVDSDKILDYGESVRPCSSSSSPSFLRKIFLSPADDRSMDESFNIPTDTGIDGKSVYSATDRKIFFLSFSVYPLS
jgi:hypothetical protein